MNPTQLTFDGDVLFFKLKNKQLLYFLINLKSDQTPVILALEDCFVDIIAKAQRGLGLDNAALVDRSGVFVREIERFKKGFLDEIVLRKVAASLGL